MCIMKCVQKSVLFGLVQRITVLAMASAVLQAVQQVNAVLLIIHCVFRIDAVHRDIHNYVMTCVASQIVSVV